MPSRRRPGPSGVAVRAAVLGVVGTLAVLLAGCGADEAPDRATGDPVTSTEAGVLAQALYADSQQGGADFEVSAPFTDDAVMTLTGEVDFAGSVGRAQAVTSYADGQPARTRTVFFTATDLWQGDVTGLAEALSSAGLPAATYARRPIAEPGASGPAPLLDVLVQMVIRLSARTADDPRSFAGYTWAGSESVNGQLVSVFQGPSGTRVAVATDSGLLVQYVTALQGFPVTITLADHGARDITPPVDTDTVVLPDHPEIAAALGL